MKRKLLVYNLGLLILMGCTDVQQISELQNELEKTKSELKDCSDELVEIKNTAENRIIRARKLLSENDLKGAKVEFQGVVENYVGTNNADIASKEIEKIDATIKQQELEAERKKALGFKILTPNSTVKYDELTLKFEKIWIGKRWTFDDYGHQYFLRDAQRGNNHVLARVSVTSENNDPVLPPIFVYKMNNGELSLLGTLKYKFRRWKDYGSYLGNYADYGNDFAHSKTIPFNCGLELSEDDLKKGTVFIVLKKKGCFNRVKSDYGNPEISYVEALCDPKSILRIDDFDNDYVLLSKL
ncbi:hypothetical protein M0G43_01285 [Subsaxibacter sp. CAU 1640]|uniref:hypothetical protein n=1 Tax=Subsaxibacter sp. CAU 1640 TaxID=2933271 RepID=UPI002005628B|nr:hypothetical protein [Subsaxibacter sp. CAU 1640]MCK7589197.1 hypothetical protein [Subsaxibacter sp. CAU 1640]